MAEARAVAWTWMMAYPMQNQAWCNFCEDIIVQQVTAEIMVNGSCNYNSITPMLVAQYMLQNSASSTEWREHVPNLVRYIEEKLVRGLNSTGEPSVAWGGKHRVRTGARRGQDVSAHHAIRNYTRNVG